jgi:poly-gamma-glutamate synthesis protein (capsule biosynthesis protein)
VRPVSLVAVGDVSPGSAIEAVRVHGPRWHWQRVGAYLRAQDIAVGNLETAVGTGGSPWPGKTFHFLAPPRTIAAAARDGGMDAVSLANNHALDFGRRTFVSGLATIRRAGIAAFGGGRDVGAALRPAVLVRGGVRVAFVGFDDVDPFDFWATSSRAGNGPATARAVRRAVHAAAARADVVVAFFHWGVELQRTPNHDQRTLARVALDAGAAIVLGAHPHVLQPIARHGRRLVAYSLGNFLFAPGSPAGTRTGALRLLLDRRGVLGAHLRPVRIVESRPVFTGP